MTTMDSLIGALVGVIALPGAKCRGRNLWDEAGPNEPAKVVEQRHAQALLLCSHCPALQPCARWLDGLSPRMKPYGVIAGRVRTRRRKEAPMLSSDEGREFDV